MHIFPNTDTRIIDFDGVIIIVIGLKTDPKLYRVLIDGVFSGYLENTDEMLIPTKGSNIRQIYIDQIAKLRNTEYRRLKSVG